MKYVHYTGKMLPLKIENNENEKKKSKNYKKYANEKFSTTLKAMVPRAIFYA